jgi:hypothetical protein
LGGGESGRHFSIASDGSWEARIEKLRESAMYVENYRSLIQGILILVFVAVAYWVSPPVGLGLLAFMGVMKLQESRTNWCPSDPVLKGMGFKKRSAS